MAANDLRSRAGVFLSRLRAARYTLAAALIVAFVLVLAPAGPAAAAVGFLAIAAAALIPTHAQNASLARRRRDNDTARTGVRARDATLEAIDLASFVLDADGNLVHQNAAAAGLFGRIPYGTHLSARFRSPAVLDMVREAIEARAARSIEHVERVPSQRWYAVRAAPLAESDEAAPAGDLFLLTFQDVTEARRVDRMRSDFVANASHELRTPLASLTGFIETLLGPARNDTKARERFLAIMLSQAERMNRLIDDLMSLSRLEVRGHVLRAERIDLSPLIAEVADTLRPQADEFGVAIRFAPPDEPAVVVGERDELIQVFQNLVENACKYGQPGAFVDIAVEHPGAGGDTPEGTIDVSVRDYGPGIAPEHVPRLTERFYRVDVESSRSKKGTGLGLAIVKHILTRHRARLVVRSELGKGSLFLVRFPAA